MPSRTVEVVELLARRARLLELLREEPRLKRDLAEELSVSRSTVDRAVRNLEAHNFVARGDTVSLTLEGELALDAFERFVGSVDGLDEATPVLDPLSPTATLDVALLRDATVVTPERDAPQRPTSSYAEEVQRATGVRGFASNVLPSTVDVFHERIVDHGVGVDLTMPEYVLEELLASHGDSVDEALDTGRLTLRTATTTLEFSLLVVDQPERTVVCALIYGDSGLAGVVKNDHEDAVRWAERVYGRIRDDAEELPT